MIKEIRLSYKQFAKKYLKKRQIKVIYEYDDSFSDEEREARLSRAFNLIFSEYEEWLKRRKSNSLKGK